MRLSAQLKNSLAPYHTFRDWARRNSSLVPPLEDKFADAGMPILFAQWDANPRREKMTVFMECFDVVWANGSLGGDWTLGLRPGFRQVSGGSVAVWSRHGL